MQAKDCKKGEIYLYDRYYLGESLGGPLCAIYMDIRGGGIYPYTTSGSTWGDTTFCEEPSEKYKAWFLTCKEARKWIPEDKVILPNLYPIF